MIYYVVIGIYDLVHESEKAIYKLKNSLFLLSKSHQDGGLRNSFSDILTIHEVDTGTERYD